MPSLLLWKNYIYIYIYLYIYIRGSLNKEVAQSAETVEYPSPEMLCRGVRPCHKYDINLFDGKVPIILEI